jgi:DNA-binding transcriptional ArsR family regulator
VEELAFSTADLARTRFVVSPMWEAGPSFRVLARGRAHAVHQTWIDDVRPRVAAAGLDAGWLADLIPPAGYVPDFLNPAPAGATPALADELAAIRATPPARVRGELDRLARQEGGLGPRARTLHADPAAHLARLTGEIEAYWALAIAPYWARIRAVLGADVFHRARQVAEHGAGHLLNDLHASVAWDDTALRLARRPGSLSREDAGPGLLLIPSVFTGPDLFTRSAPPDPPQLAYPARGAGTLWETRPAADSLAAVLGRARARLLAELGTPASTTELARRTGLSAPGVSQHLTALRDAGLVSAHRAGRWVLYARTTAADAVLDAAAR